MWQRGKTIIVVDISLHSLKVLFQHIHYDALYIELDDLVNRCNVPSKNELISTSSSDVQIEWDPIDNFCQGDNQIVESYDVQMQSIQLCKRAIDDYLNINKQTTLTKSVAI